MSELSDGEIGGSEKDFMMDKPEHINSDDDEKGKVFRRVGDPDPVYYRQESGFGNQNGSEVFTYIILSKAKNFEKFFITFATLAAGLHASNWQLLMDVPMLLLFTM